MVTKTDFQAIGELAEQYSPARRGIVNEREARLIRAVLELAERDEIELANIRNMTVMWYFQRCEKYSEKDSEKCEELFDAMSAITAVIDDEKFTRGMEV